MHLTLLVIRCQNIENSKIFYEFLGLTFQKEKHGSGVEHFSCQYNNTTFELYPNKGVAPNDNVRLGFNVKNLDKIIENIEVVSSYSFNENKIYVVLDPDGRKVELS